MSVSTSLEPAPTRLTRSSAERGPSLAARVTSEVARLSYKTGVHQLQLRGTYPARLLANPTDPFPGSPEAGRALLAGRLDHGGHVCARPIEWRVPAPPSWRAHAHGFGWLRDLAAADPARGASVAEVLTRSWIAAFERFDPIAWAPDLVGARTLAWTLHARLLLDTRDLVLRSAILSVMARGCRHLDRAIEQAPDGPLRIVAAIGAAAGGLALPDGDALLARGEIALACALRAWVADDGAIPTRSPAGQLLTLERLIALGAVYAARARPVPPAQLAVRGRLAAALGALRLGDGGLAPFHGGADVRAARLEAALRLAVPGQRVTPRASAGYVRLTSGALVLLVDAGPPPGGHASKHGHPSTLAFALSDGPDRLIVDRGGEEGAAAPAPPALARALRRTDAHSTLAIADACSTRIEETGLLGRGVAEVVARIGRTAAGAQLDARHDGYARAFGVDHRRLLTLGANGGGLEGEDSLVDRRAGAAARAGFALHFHLAADVTAALDGAGAILATPRVRWRFTTDRGALAIDPSPRFDAEGRVRAASQLVVRATGAAPVCWSLTRLPD